MAKSKPLQLNLIISSYSKTKGVLEIWQPQKWSWSLFIDTKGQKVFFAEAEKDFEDFLFHLLSLALATVFWLLKQKLSGLLSWLSWHWKLRKSFFFFLIVCKRHREIFVRHWKLRGLLVSVFCWLFFEKKNETKNSIFYFSFKIQKRVWYHKRKTVLWKYKH